MYNWAALAGDLPRDVALPDHERRLSRRVALSSRPAARITTDRAGSRTVGLVKDLSLTGLGLVLGLALEPGQRIVVEFEWRGQNQCVLASVAHCRQTGDGKFAAGVAILDDAPGVSFPEKWLAQLSAQA